jgi:hypothetical protein
LFDCATGERIARDRNEDSGDEHEPDLSCEGIGVLTGCRVPMAGLYGGGLHSCTPDTWSVHVVAPAWPAERVVLADPFHDPFADPDGRGWCVIHEDFGLRATGFSPSGHTLVVASGHDVALFVRP